MKPIFKQVLILSILLSITELSFSQACYQTFLDQGISAYNELNFETAINQFKAAKICEDIPVNNEVDDWIEKAQNGYIDAIKKARDEAIALKTESEALRYFSIGQELECKGFFQEAFDEFSKAINIQTQDISYRERRAQLAIHAEVQAYAIAKEDLEFLIQNGSEDKRANYEARLVEVLELMDELDEAILVQTSAFSKANVEQKVVYNDKLENLKKRKRMNDSAPGTSIRNPSKTKNVFLKIKEQKGFAGCEFNITIKIGGKTFSPVGKRFNLKGLKPGTYNYEISGVITCPNLQPWPALGSGPITISENSIYSMNWEKNKYGRCKMWVSNF